MKKLISIVVPAYNEEGNIAAFYSTLTSVLEKHASEATLAHMPTYEYEVIFINDGSEDKTAELVSELASKNPHVKYIEFSRNFGKEVATSAGLHHAHGASAIIVDADLQHPIHLIPEFITKWEQGAEMVVGVRKANQGEGMVKKVGSYFFYKLMNAIAEVKTIPGSTDYRLIDRKVIDEFNRFTERQRMTRGLLDWLGFKKDYIYFVANSRTAGKASYRTSKLIKLAISSFVSNSLFPLKFAGYLGIVIILVSTLLGLFMFTERFVLGDPWHFAFSGTALLAVAILFLVGIMLSCLGLIALYIANIHGEVVNRPLYAIRERINF
jgi:dolichol-phosphate mannosyltransferase